MENRNTPQDLGTILAEVKKGNWKIIVLPFLLCAALLYVLYVYIPNRQDMSKTDFYYTNYERAEAEILDTYGNGRIGKGQKTLYKIQYTTANGEKVESEYQQDTFFSKDKGDKIVIYYDKESPTVTTSEERFLEEKKILDKQAANK
ncbi:MAG: DUF3592 domain-containing protein [Myroides sp.]|jgi:site-specific DNA-cytosine methylase|nr:DUF3592 domain-containing protein [Myroides sp.]